MFLNRDCVIQNWKRQKKTLHIIAAADTSYIRPLGKSSPSRGAVLSSALRVTWPTAELGSTLVATLTSITHFANGYMRR